MILEKYMQNQSLEINITWLKIVRSNIVWYYKKCKRYTITCKIYNVNFEAGDIWEDMDKHLSELVICQNRYLKKAFIYLVGKERTDRSLVSGNYALKKSCIIGKIAFK